MSRGSRAIFLLLALLLPGWSWAQASLRITAQLELPNARQPYPLRLSVDGEAYALDRTGSLEIPLEPGEHALVPDVAAEVDGPRTVTLAAGETARAEFVVRPRVDVALRAEPAVVREGETVVITARATTDFDGVLPLDLEVLVPDGLELRSGARLTAPLSQRTPRELAIEAVAIRRGEWRARGVAGGWGEAGATIRVLKPATIEVAVAPEVDAATILEPASWRIEVTNAGDDPATGVRVLAQVPEGMEGVPLDQALDLAPGETRAYDLSGLVLADAPETVEATVEARMGESTSVASSRLPVRRPQPSIERTLPGEAVLPGETFTVELAVVNGGEASLAYQLVDTAPEWLEVAEPPRFDGTLAPGERAVHAYEAQVRFGADSTGRFYGELATDVGTFGDEARLERRLVPVQVRVEQPALRVGSTTRAVVRLSNPSSHEARLRLQAAPDAPLRAAALPDEVVLPAGESIELPVELAPDRAGTFRYEITAFNGTLPASFPAGAELTVVDPLAPQRTSTLALPFDVDAAGGNELLLRHRLPPGASYRPGTSALSGSPIADPLVAHREDGTFLYWRVPYAPEGELVYAVGHAEPIGILEAPALTLLDDRREAQLAGEATLAELEQARPIAARADGMILEPAAGAVVRTSDQMSVVVEAPFPGALEVLVNDEPIPQRSMGKAEFDEVGGTQRQEYFGVALQPGRNVIAAVTQLRREERVVWLARSPVELEIRPLSLVANGSTPLTFELVARDESGIENGFGPVTIESNVEPHAPDAFPAEPGHQVLLRDGRATVELEPLATVQRVELAATFNRLETSRTFDPSGRGSTLLVGHGSVTVRLRGGAATVEAAARAYLETPLAGGTLQAALDSTSPLMPSEHESERFPLTGAENEAQPGLRSVDGVAAKYDHDGFSVGYYHGPIRIPGLGGTLEATALQARGEWAPADGHDVAADVFVALLPDERVTERIRPDGTRLYRLERRPEPGSETVAKVIGEGADELREPLRRGVDYTIDDLEGTIVLAEPLWNTTPSFEPVVLEVSYAPAGVGRGLLAGGAGVRYRYDGGWTLEAGARSGDALELGASVAYESAAGDAELGYAYEAGEGSRLNLAGRLREGPFDGDLRVRYGFATGDLSADVQATVELLDRLDAEIRHRYSSNLHETSLLFESGLDPLALGLGAVLDWRDPAPTGLARASWRNDRFDATLEHRQPFGRDLPSETELETGFQILEGLRLESGMAYRPGLGLDGAIDLVREVGDANFSVSYLLPGSSSDGNRARFGMDMPIPIDDHWSIELSAGYERGLASGENEAASSVGFDYRTDDLIASLAMDVSLRDARPRLVFRGGASGVVDEFTTLSLDATFEVAPSFAGSATVSHAYRDGTRAFLTYNRLTLGTLPMVEGEVAYTNHPSTRWQLRRSFAYRVPLERPESALFQLSLGGNVHPRRHVSVGGTIHHLIQPAQGSSTTALGAEAGYELLPGAWLNAGYTFFGFEGLTADSRGFHVRLDLLGARQ